MFGTWTHPHIGEEILKVHPPITDFYAAPTIIPPEFSVWVKATIPYGCPRFVFGTITQSMNGVYSRRVVSLKAAARFAFTTRYTGASGKNHIAAIALTFPEPNRIPQAVYALASKPNDVQAAKLFSNQIPKVLVRWQWTRDYSGRFDVLAHIVFSEGRFLTGGAAFACLW